MYTPQEKVLMLSSISYCEKLNLFSHFLVRQDASFKSLLGAGEVRLPTRIQVKATLSCKLEE